MYVLNIDDEIVVHRTKSGKKKYNPVSLLGEATKNISGKTHSKKKKKGGARRVYITLVSHLTRIFFPSWLVTWM